MHDVNGAPKIYDEHGNMYGVTVVFVDGKWANSFGNPACHYMWGFRRAMRKFDPLFDLW